MHLTLDRRQPGSKPKGFSFTIEILGLSVTLRFWLRKRPGWWKQYDHVDDCVLFPTRYDVGLVIHRFKQVQKTTV